ncbi:MAG: acetate--CoA ligase [Candidatus Eisenbacteria bacterium]|uniref:acetate--CoA ligase n=1 Tax=Eiseniibacteriota bacterium TaxID=2212470 RepID=A0A538TV33_UNCEI|nr:MAG: acetate--CoA ligase [Candidatus Eisenbacteria bacterium]
MTAKETLPPLPGHRANLADYDTARRSFEWASVEDQFDWKKTGRVNMAHEAIDRHARGSRRDKVALIYTDGERVETYTFADLMRASNRFASALATLGIGKGDRVFVFLPRVPETYIGILGVLKLGAIPSPLFEAFMSDAVRDRMLDAGAVALLTNRTLLERVPQGDLPDLKHVVLVGDTAGARGEAGRRLHAFDDLIARGSEVFEPEWLSREDPLILHYTSGSTGKPKGALHVQNAMIGHYQTGRWVLDLKEDDVYWCTADPGWVTGTSYGIFSPWLNGATNVIRGGRFDPEGWYQTIERLKVTVWYSAPTAFRMLMAAGEELVRKYDLSSLRHVLSVGEPLNPEVVRWGWRVYGRRIHDNWWMTETGHQLISNYPSMEIRPGSMGKPIPGVEAVILDENGKPVPPGTLGLLCIKAGWPGMMRAIWNNPARYQEYFRFPGYYVTGDTSYVDEDGYFWFQGRADDVINTAGERVGPFEVESALVSHPAVAEAGVIGKPDELRGQIIKAFVALRSGFEPSETLKEEIARHVKQHLAGHAAPREIEFRDKLPKTRSGKIMRRVLKAWDQGLPTGDISTLED